MLWQVVSDLCCRYPESAKFWRSKKNMRVRKPIWKNFELRFWAQNLKSFLFPKDTRIDVPNLRNNVNFEKILIFLQFKNNFFAILKFWKKCFFLNFCLVLQANLNVFLICHQFSSILCATCPQIKKNIGDNTLIPKMINSRLVCICGHVAHFFF